MAAALLSLVASRLSLDFRSSIVNERSLKRMPQGNPYRDCACLFKKIIVSFGGSDGAKINIGAVAPWRIIGMAKP